MNSSLASNCFCIPSGEPVIHYCIEATTILPIFHFHPSPCWPAQPFHMPLRTRNMVGDIRRIKILVEPRPVLIGQRKTSGVSFFGAKQSSHLPALAPSLVFQFFTNIFFLFFSPVLFHAVTAALLSHPVSRHYCNMRLFACWISQEKLWCKSVTPPAVHPVFARRPGARGPPCRVES